MSGKKTITKAFTVFGIHGGEDFDIMRRRIFVIVLLLFITPIIMIFAYFDVIERNTEEAVMELVFCAFAVYLIFSTGRVRNPIPRFRIILLMASVLMLFWTYTGGESGSKILWAYFLPPALLFTLGKREGLLWNCVVYFLYIQRMIFNPPGSYPYALPFIFRFLVSYGIIILIAYIYESVRHHFHVMLSEEKEHLAQEQNRLKQAHDHIKQISRLDPLTGLYNRNYMNERLPEEIRRALRYRRNLSIILCDVDHFKQINDELGHMAGDRVLKEIAAVFDENVRKDIDWIVRYGGEEFLIVLPETDLGGACLVAERLRGKIESLRVATELGPCRVTASFGIAPIEPDCMFDADPDSLISTADRHLYSAKSAGRNRVAYPGSTG